MVNNTGKTIAIIQARMGSTRLPGKAMLHLAGKPVIQWVIDRVKSADVLDEIWLATTQERIDDIIATEGEKAGVRVFRGSESDVLQRFYRISVISNPQIVVRVTADNPLTDPRLINKGVCYLQNQGLDYVNFVGIPVGTGAEIIANRALVKAYKMAGKEEEKEHVTMFIKQRSDLFSCASVPSSDFGTEYADGSVTLDTLEDYVKIYKLF